MRIDQSDLIRSPQFPELEPILNLSDQFQLVLEYFGARNWLESVAGRLRLGRWIRSEYLFEVRGSVQAH